MENTQDHRPPGARAAGEDPFGPRDGTLVIGHRGAAGAAPENTLPSLRTALEDGVDALEFDLQCSADGRLVVHHDDTVDRTTEGSGPVASLTLAELRELDAGWAFTPDRGASFPFRGQGVRIPTLEEALEVTGELPVVAEVKSVAAGRALAAWLGEHPDGRKRMIVGGFDREAVAPAAARARWRCGYRRQLAPYVLLGKLGLGRLAVPDVDAAMVPERERLLRIVTRRFVRQCHRDGIGVHVWTVNRPDRVRALLDIGVDGLISDVPARVRRVLEERAALGVAAGGPLSRDRAGGSDRRSDGTAGRSEGGDAGGRP